MPQSSAISALTGNVLYLFLYILRILVPIFSGIVVLRCYRSVKQGRRPDEPVVMLEDTHSHVKIPVLFWENSIGRSKSCDIVIPDPTISRDHAVLMRRETGWMITDTNSKAGTYVNNRRIKEPSTVVPGDVITMGSSSVTLKRAEEPTQRKHRFFSFQPQKRISSFSTMLIVSLVHILLAVQCCFAGKTFQKDPLILLGIVLILDWSLYIFSMNIIGRVNFEVETVAMLLSGTGLFLLAGVSMKEITTQLPALISGMVLFCIMLWFMGDLNRIMRWRLPIAVCAVLLLAATLAIGTSINGSKNWIFLGPVSIQPSELAKIAFIFAGASTLDKLQTTRNLTEFIVLTGLCGACLVVMRDLGSAVIFFVTFLIIAFMRSGSLRTIALICSAAGIGIFMFLKAKPYAAARILGWRHVWEHINDSYGYQQSRVLTYSASGGFFGMGLGKGCLKYVAAGDSDLVFGMICEELGLLLALVITTAIMLFIFYARSDVTRSRSTFYSISACAAAGMLLFQTCLNVFGPTDVLPLTGVTLPFISAGGSSMISVWGLMAFIKASDERTYAARRRVK